MPKQKKKSDKTLETLVENLSTAVKEVSKQQSDKKTKYVVVRDNYRVSDIEYEDPNDERAISERDFWMRVISRHPDGTKVRIVQYDNKIHRVY